MKRRNVLAGLGALITGGCTKIGQTEWVGDLVDGAEKLSRGAHRMLGARPTMAREFSVADISPYFRGNGNTEIDTDTYRAQLASGFPDWRLEVRGLVDRPLSLSLEQILVIGGGADSRLWLKIVADSTGLPVVRSLYKGVKQVFETIFSQSGTSFRKVGMVQFPQPGMWSIVFIAQDAAPEIAGRLPDGDEQIGVFLPCTPNPTTGFFFYLPRREVVEVAISVEEGAKLIMSAGMIQPGDALGRNGANGNGGRISP